MRARLTALWRGLRSRRPEVTEAATRSALAVRGRAALLREVRDLQRRLHVVERDAELLAAHVAALTARVESTAAPADVADRLTAARLGAISGYEQRIAALEEHAGASRHARGAAVRGSIPRIPAEPEVNGR